MPLSQFVVFLLEEVAFLLYALLIQRNSQFCFEFLKKMRPSSKASPAMAGPTGPVPPGLIILLLSVTDEIIPIRVSLSQAIKVRIVKCRCRNLTKISPVRRYSLINVYTYDFKTFGPVPLGLNSRSKI